MGNKSTLKRCDKNDKQSMRLSQSTRYKLQSAFGVNSMKPLARSVSKLKPKKQHRFYKGTH